ncbi:probable LRR receptor-like serine/threonine-protein kinase At3g47570 [Neltuma alba]|uniref:probable LRR receptor-like serine/threonine-protein kinase At3g47570 n=1 Tax=Neltuma alba TaxID=207710 RepID=UPI0010A2CC13|nr:probable LRR receptor-like serine/threonine-protein kinase At3g47570 [Prosopis alba]
MGFFSHMSLHFGLCIFPLASHVLFLCISSSTALDIATDTEALISFKSQLSNIDPPHPLSSWNQSSSSPCNWYGVTCNRLRQRVIDLNLSGLRLSGQLSPSIGNLSFLESLQLRGNQFTGVIPDQIGHLIRLRSLDLSSNRIEGMLPSNITRLANLVTLNLSSNYIVSQIPQDIDSLTKLQVLRMGSNRLYGVVPPTLGNISSLTNISWLKNLIELDLTINNLTGAIPSSIYNLSSLVNLAVADNDFWGVIPQDIGHRLPKLLVFNICFNRFTGRIPWSLHNLTNIQVIRMASNLLEGTVPPGLGNLPFLRMYNIGYNRIVSSKDGGLEFIASLANCTLLSFLAIDGNRLEGVIPETIGNFSKVLSKLYMGGNRFHGNIPPSIGNLRGLSLLNLSYNAISGEIPFELSQLEKLQELSLAGNQISGSIPNSLGRLQMLNRLYLSGNQLGGEIPSSFGDFQNIVFMDLSHNKLNGSIPREVLSLSSLSTILNMSKNLLSGSLPQEVGSLIKVSTLDFSDNLLVGEIPSSISNCLSLENLFLARNMFSGFIPKALGSIRGLEILDLSSNQISGSVPVELQNLNALRLLNLSYNDLEGVIPSAGVFKNISSFHFEGNEKLCLLSSCVTQGRGRKMLIIYITIPVVVTFTLCFILGLLLYVRSRRTKAITPLEMAKPYHPMVSYDELRRATRNFSQENLLGIGSFGSVYRGYLSEENAVAVKVLDTSRSGSLKSFYAECEALRNVRHRNLVKLITSCSSIDFKNKEFLALVYEFMSNGNLEDWIKGKIKHANGNGLNLLERLNIAIDVACAMEYLHDDSETPIVHCDLKPSNILLCEDMIAKVGDFGLARLMIERPTNQVSISSTHVLRGSIGYIPPEYGWGEKPSAAGDTYSFGIILLQLFSGRSPTDDHFAGGLSLTRWVQSAFPDKTLQVIDPQLLSHIFHNGLADRGPSLQLDCVNGILGVGLSCTADSPDERLKMKDAATKLKIVRDNLSKLNQN